MSSSNVENKEIVQAAFSDKARKKLWIPESVLKMPDMGSREVISWMHKSNHIGFVMLNIGGDWSGIVMERGSAKNTSAIMCDWCCAVYAGGRVLTFSYQKDKTSSVAVPLCSSLDCEARLLDPHTNNVHSMRETLTKEEKIARFHRNVQKFWSNNVL